MAIKIEKTFQVKHSIEPVWQFLTDPRKIVTCIPGAQITEEVDDRHYKGTISMKVGPATTNFQGEVEIVRLDAQTREIEIVGKGKDVGGRGSATMKMTSSVRSLPEGGAEVVSVAEVSIAGLLAQIGSRMIHEVSNITFQQFSTCFQQQLEQSAQTTSPDDKPAPPASGSQPIKALPLLLSVIWASIRRLFHLGN
jgi:uncharacterized protein